MENSTKNQSSLFSDESTEDFYHGFFQMRLSLILFASYSVIVTPIAIGFLYSIIWYEHNGSESRRTLVNQLVSPICWTCIAYIAIPQSVDFCRYFNGPHSHVLCNLNLYMKNVLTVMFMLFLICIAISKYVSIFVLKNPLVFLDDFWCRAICLWAFLISSLIQFVLDFLPGKYQLNYFICTGKNPEFDANKELKVLRHYSLLGGCILALAVSIFVRIRVSYYKKKVNSQADHLVINSFDKKLLTGDLIPITLGILSIFQLMLVYKMQTLDMTKMDVYPNYLYIYYHHFWLLPNFSLILTILYYARNQPLREMVVRELKNMLSRYSYFNECYSLNV